MKKLLTIVIAVVAVIAIGGLSVNHYKNYQKTKQAQGLQLISVKDANKQIRAIQTAEGSEYQSLVVRYNSAVAECQKGSNAYTKLTSALKLQTAPPVCPAPQN